MIRRLIQNLNPPYDPPDYENENSVEDWSLWRQLCPGILKLNYSSAQNTN